MGKTIGSRLQEMEVKVALNTAPALREGASDESSRIDFDPFGEDGVRDRAFFATASADTTRTLAIAINVSRFASGHAAILNAG